MTSLKGKVISEHLFVSIAIYNFTQILNSTALRLLLSTQNHTNMCISRMPKENISFFFLCCPLFLTLTFMAPSGCVYQLRVSS